MVPQGGGGVKSPLRTLLSIAVLAASPVIATSLAGALGATGSVLGISTARLVMGGVNLLGRLAVNAWRHPRPRYNMGQKEAPVYSIHGAQTVWKPSRGYPRSLAVTDLYRHWAQCLYRDAGWRPIPAYAVRGVMGR